MGLVGKYASAFRSRRTGIQPAESLPEQTRLLPNYPNPFNPETWIPFELSQDSEVSVSICDIVGTPVRSIGLVIICKQVVMLASPEPSLGLVGLIQVRE